MIRPSTLTESLPAVVEATKEVFSTEHLYVDHRERVRLRASHGRAWPLGYIDEDPEWPEPLGQEPDWFARELADLRDQWDDAIAADYRDEVLTTYERGIGALA